MSLEIEHKYLVKDDSYREAALASYIIKQAYLCREPERTVRVRIKGNKGFLTVKGKNSGDTRLEFEYEIPFADALSMIGLCSGRVIEKIRYIVDFQGFRWEVDEFKGELDGLTLAEIELESSNHNYPLPPFVGKDVTGNPEYYNSNL